MYIKADESDKQSPFYRLEGTTLYYEGAGWYPSIIGTKAYSLEDTGNGYIFRDHYLGAKTSLDYSQLEAIKLLLKQMDK